MIKETRLPTMPETINGSFQSLGSLIQAFNIVIIPQNIYYK